ncbi:MAG: MFS transporter [Fimbriimonas ginsengisoli]|uniref:MFS transporter n=1 Tax=Fimbriimonas ginsengisoli TaxID=1005039 RepID=A0A931LVA7_FIMGI|nr:MFS transporter [Fimbriimonas ginsengisoli]
MRALRHRDFRLLWIGAFLSFTGSWVQTVAQGWLAYQITGQDEAKLAFVTFCGMAPVSILGPFAGTLTDTYNKRWLLILAQALFAAGALFLALAVARGFIQYWHLVAVALLFGVVGAFEMPTRHSLVSRVVPPEDLANAIPINGMTFNLARLIGPAIGGWVYHRFGAETCYGANGISYLALIFAVMAMRTDMRATESEPQPIKDLLLEGMLYTFRDRRLRNLFVLESATSTFGLIYVPLMPAIVAKLLTSQVEVVGYCFTWVGVGAVAGLLFLARMADRPIKARVVKLAMMGVGLTLFALAFVRERPIAYGLLAMMGVCSIMQFNLTNTLFQLLSPERLRGRVIAMHIWALSGMAPIGIILSGWVARQVSIPFALEMGGLGVVVFALWGWLNRGGLAGVG